MKSILRFFGLVPERKQFEQETLLPSGIQLWTHFYHITHNRNLEGIRRHGILAWSRAHSEGFIDTDISDPSVQQRRNRPEPVFKQSIHDYAPLYLNPKNPMLYVRKHLQHEIVILFISPTVLDNGQHVFTDGNAAAGATQFSRNRSVVAESETVLLAPRWVNSPMGNAGDALKFLCTKTSRRATLSRRCATTKHYVSVLPHNVHSPSLLMQASSSERSSACQSS